MGCSHEPAVIAGEPKYPKEYREQLVDNVKTYISRRLSAQKIKIVYRRLLFFERLEAQIT